jgi:Fe-S cluster biosynthesis and repair protein YggX
LILVAGWECGYRSVLEQCGVKEIRGLDGAWIDKNTLKIAEEKFTTVNLEEEISLKQKYDLAISLEVTEHLPESYGIHLIDSLTKASDFVLFSAAIPYQGGTNHINEQWPEYLNTLFNERGFIAVDFLRKKIWNEADVYFFYKENMILYVKKEQLKRIKALETDFCIDNPPLSLMHHYLWSKLVGNRVLLFLREFRIQVKRLIVR